jgi:hypothetical protein
VEQAYTTQAGAGLVAIGLKNGMIAHHSPSFQDLASWIPVEARGNIRVALESRDGDDFHSFCQSVVRDAGEPHGETFLGRDKIMGRSITVRFLTRAPGPPGLRNPEWLLMVRAVKLTLVGVQPRQLAAGSTIPFFGQAWIPEAIGVFTADMSGGMPSQWTVQAAHIRNLLDLEVASGTYDIEVRNLQPLQLIATLFNFEFSKEEGAGASLFSSAVAHLEYAATSALNITQRATSWLTRKALQSTQKWSMRLNEDDTVTISSRLLLRIVGGLSTSLSMDIGGGELGFSHGGLDFLYFVADPAQPLDGNVRATTIRIGPDKTAGEYDVTRPFVFSCTWGFDNYQGCCKMLSFEALGKKVPSEKDVSQLLEELKLSPGGGHLSDGNSTVCLGQSDV